MKAKKYNLIITIMGIIIIMFAYLSIFQANKSNEMYNYIEVANSNTLYLLGQRLGKIHSLLEWNVFNDEDKSSHLENETVQLLINKEIEYIDSISITFVRTDNVRISNDLHKLSRLSMGLSNYFANIANINDFSNEKKDALLTNLQDFEKKIILLNNDDSVSTEDKLHRFIEYLLMYDNWEKGLKRDVLEMIQ